MPPIQDYYLFILFFISTVVRHLSGLTLHNNNNNVKGAAFANVQNSFLAPVYTSSLEFSDFQTGGCDGQTNKSLGIIELCNYATPQHLKIPLPAWKSQEL